MRMNMTMRKITREDREAYLNMAHNFYHSEAVLHPVPDEHFARAFDEMMRSEDYLLGLIFEMAGRIAGYALLVKTYSQEAGGTAVWIDEIFVLPEFRGQGVAKAFFAELRSLVPAARYRLEIEPDNLRAEKLYRGVGFDELGYKQLVMDFPQ